MSGKRMASVVSGVVLAFAFGIGTAGPTWASSKSATKTPDLAPQLLTISEMPAGWLVDTSPPTTSCLTAPFHGVAGKAEAAYRGSGGVPVMTEILLPGGASKCVSVKKSLDGCHTFPISNGSSSVSATMSALSFPPVGQKSAAYGISFTVDGTAGVEDVVLALKGSTVMGLLYGDANLVDVAVVEGFTNQALDKVSPLTTNAKVSGSGTTTTTAVPPNSPTHPVPFGQSAAIPGGWTVTVLKVAPDPADDPDNPDPVQGYVNEVYSLQVTRTASPGAAPSTSINVEMVGPSRAERSLSSDPICFGDQTPGDQPDNDPVLQGGTIAAGGCISVTTADSNSLTLGLGSYESSNLTWFATK